MDSLQIEIIRLLLLSLELLLLVLIQLTSVWDLTLEKIWKLAYINLYGGVSGYIFLNEVLYVTLTL